jgi:hypothetical protein
VCRLSSISTRRTSEQPAGVGEKDTYDTDAMSIAAPYCAVVVADKAAADALRRVNTRDRPGDCHHGEARVDTWQCFLKPSRG